LRRSSIAGGVAAAAALVGAGFAGGVLASRSHASAAPTCLDDRQAIERRLDSLEDTLATATRLLLTAVQRGDRRDGAGGEIRVATTPPSAEQPAATAAGAGDKAGSSTDPTRVAASTAAKQILERALSSHRWGAEERDALREHMGLCDDETRQEIIRRLSAAINSGEVEFKAPGPLF
jgi:hypothetical protein